MQLTHCFEMYIPTKCACGSLLDAGQRSTALIDAQSRLSTWFGGGTAVHGNGFWVSDRLGLIREDVDVVFSNADEESFDAHKDEFLEYAVELADKLGQELVACRIDGVLHLKEPTELRCAHGYQLADTEQETAARRRAFSYVLAFGLSRLGDKSTARELFTDLLHYDPASRSVDTSRWPESVQSIISTESAPEVMASRFGSEVIMVRLNTESLRRSDIRAVAECVLQDDADWSGLLVFATSEGNEWSFVSPKRSDSGTGRTSYLVREVRLEPHEDVRIAVRRLLLLDAAEAKSTDDLKAQYDNVFDVRGLTREFFSEYERVFTQVKSKLEGFAEERDEQRHSFAQNLLNRLMFLAFVEKKGWLRFRGSTDYLAALWSDYLQKRTEGSSFYAERLRPLFFDALNCPAANRRVSRDLIGEVPYLNGGLFSQTPDDLDPDVGVPDECFHIILHDLFAPFDFTVAEDTPLDQQVAVDPEMLGQVFERLIVGRHQKGAYYTPPEIVAYMCRESLKSWLSTAVPQEGYSQIADFVDNHNPGLLQHAREVMSALDGVKVCDPACGSGAYLVGMMHELLELSRCLFGNLALEPRTAYDRKLAIIQNNVYGVDLDPVAVNIARLRLWLSLAVEYDGNDPQPLPNLDFKIGQGDSLTAPDPHGGPQPDLFREEQVRSLDLMMVQYADPYWIGDKAGLRTQIEDLLCEIARWMHPGTGVAGFDWRVNFAEVFRNGGFDIVLANPPYGEGSVTDSLRDELFGKGSGQSKDIYAAFMARAFHLMRPGGTMSYITSNTWRTLRTHRCIRQIILDRSTVLHVIDLPEWIFQSAVVRTCILTLRNEPARQNHTLVAADLKALPSNDWATLKANLRVVGSRGADQQTETFARYTYEQSLIMRDPNMAFFIALPSLQRFFSDRDLPRLGDESEAVATVVQGLATADNEYYLRVSGAGRNGCRPVDPDLVLTDAEIREFTARPEQDRLKGINPVEFGGRHFIPYDKGGSADLKAGGWLPCYHVPTGYYIDWSEDAVNRLREATIADCKRRRGQKAKIKQGDKQKIASRLQNAQHYFQPAIVYSNTGRYAPTFRWSSGYIFDHKCCAVLAPQEQIPSLLAVLNSKFMFMLSKCFLNVGWGLETDDGKRLPIVTGALEHPELRRLVDSIAGNQRADPRYPYWSHEGLEIDSIVGDLYGLTDEERRDIDLWFCRYEHGRLAKARGLIA